MTMLYIAVVLTCVSPIDVGSCQIINSPYTMSLTQCDEETDAIVAEAVAAKKVALTWCIAVPGEGV